MNNRRDFLRVAGIWGLGTLANSGWRGVPLSAAGQKSAPLQADILLLSCMDFRLVDVPERHMASRGLKGKYDHVILAGAALGATTDKYPSWNQGFWDHLDVAIQFHGVHKVVIMDHRDCGAYKVLLGEDFSKDPAKEMSIHAATMGKLRDQIKAKHPTFDVELLLIGLNGKVETVRI